MENYFPGLTDSFLAGQDLLYQQFNEIEFYVEDKDQEHFYFNILKRLFSKLKFEKIFPLKGKSCVINNAKLNIGNKKKVYIIDLDFDHILNKIENIDNLFYLDQYSIENYLISKEAIYEMIRAKSPKLKNYDIDLRFSYNELLKTARKCLYELTCSFIVIQKHNLRIEFYGLNPSRDFDFSVNPPCYRMNFISDYLKSIEVELIRKNKKLLLSEEISDVKKYFRTLSLSLKNIPGKYLLNYIKERLQNLGLIHQVTIEAFTYSLSKEINPNDFKSLKTRISDYVS